MDEKELIYYLTTEDRAEIEALLERADAVRREVTGDAVELRALIELSNHCVRDCLYCGLRKSNAKLERYRIESAELIETVLEASRIGYKTAVLQSGEDPGFSTDELCDLIQKIKDRTDMALTLAFGERPRRDIEQFRAAGADRYLLKIETTDPELFRRLKPDGSFERRVGCLKLLKECGFQVGSGSMIGLPGQTPEIIARDILFFKDMDLDMIGVGPFVPNEDTPLGHESGGTVDMSLRVIALTRIVTVKTHMPATTSIGAIDPAGREKVLKAGANVLMPNLTPAKYREHYRIYPKPARLPETPEESRKNLEIKLKKLGRSVSDSHGHSLKRRAGAVQ